MKTVSDGKVTIEVRRETVRARMHNGALCKIAALVIDELVEETGFDYIALEANLINFAAIVPNMKVVKGALDFEFPAHNEAPEKFKAIYTAYLDSQFLALLEKATKTMNEISRAQDADLLPGVIIPDGEKKS